MTTKETNPIADVLAIAAHRDDVEQTCGGTLLRMAARGLRTAAGGASVSAPTQTRVGLTCVGEPERAGRNLCVSLFVVAQGWRRAQAKLRFGNGSSISSAGRSRWPGGCSA